MALVALSEFKRWYLDDTGHATDADGNSLDSQYQRVLDAASLDIRKDTGRIFERLTDQARTLRIDVDGYVRFKDLIAGTIDAVLIDQNADDTPETTVASTDYLLGPLTEGEGEAPARYQWMRAKRNSSARFGIGWLVQITADWGYVETVGGADYVPEDIELACMIRAAWLLERRNAKLGTVAVPALGVAAKVQATDHDYRALIEPYIHPWISMPAGG